MLNFICAAPNDDLSLIKSLGFAGIRFSPPPAGTQWDLAPMAQVNMKGIWIVNSPKDVDDLQAHKIPSNLHITVEVVNEPNLNGWTPINWAGFVTHCHANLPYPVISGGISNLSPPQLDFLEEALYVGMNCDGIAYHTYRTEKRPPEPLDAYKKRHHEFQALHNITDGLPIWCTEVGWHTQPQKRKVGPFGLFSKKVQWTDEDVASFAKSERAWHSTFGAEVMAWYQLWDGPSDNYEDHFGIRRTDGSLKPVANSFA